MGGAVWKRLRGQLAGGVDAACLLQVAEDAHALSVDVLGNVYDAVSHVVLIPRILILFNV